MESQGIPQQFHAPCCGNGSLEPVRVVRKLACIIGVFASWSLYASAGYAGEDEWQGLPAGVGREEVFYACQACHSLKLVTQQGLDRYDWEETLVWMIEDQGMAKPDEEEWPLILEYLSTFYGRDKLAASMAAEN